MTAQVSFLRTRPLWNIIRLGITLAALAPAVVSSFGPSIQSVVAFVLILTLGDALYNPRRAAALNSLGVRPGARSRARCVRGACVRGACVRGVVFARAEP